MAHLHTAHLLRANLHMASSQPTDKHQRRRPTASPPLLTDNRLLPPATHHSNPTAPPPQPTANLPTAHPKPTHPRTSPHQVTSTRLRTSHGTAARTHAPSARQ